LMLLIKHRFREVKDQLLRPVLRPTTRIGFQPTICRDLRRGGSRVVVLGQRAEARLNKKNVTSVRQSDRDDPL